MSLATIERIIDITPHPNADTLVFAHVLNYKCLVKKDEFKVGELVILIQPDSVLPQESWTEPYKKFCRTRVKATRLRGEWSFGIVDKVDKLLPDGVLYAEGDDVTEALGITKYEAPTPKELNAKGGLPYGCPKTDEDRWQSLKNKDLVPLFGSLVDLTLKVDGQSFSCFYHIGDDRFGVCGRSFEYNLPQEGDTWTNNYIDQVKRYDLENKLKSYCVKYNISIFLRGESYGQGIQSFDKNPHSKLSKGCAFYSVWLIDEHKYAGKGHPHYFTNVCKELSLPTVDVLEENVPLTRELIHKYDEVLEEINGVPFEGVVIKGQDFSFKVINKYYDSKK